MTGFDERDVWPDEDLLSLQTLDMGAGRALQTRQACLEALGRRRARPSRHRRLAWAEPLAATAAGLVYLAAAVHASLALLRL
jgi:hypothetical protein